MLHFKKTVYNYQDSLHIDFNFEADNTLKLSLKLAAEMNPGNAKEAIVIIEHIKISLWMKGQD